jgi:hypothetical protein
LVSNGTAGPLLTDEIDATKPKCNSFGEYVLAAMNATSVAYFDFVKKPNNNDIRRREDLQRCFSGCPKRFCQTWNYRIDKTITEHILPSNMPDFWNSKKNKVSKIMLYVEERKLKVIEEQVAYGLNQLIGEVGGT